MLLFSLGALQGPACDWFSADNIPSASNPQGINIAGFQDSEFDHLCQEALGALEENERASLHREAQLQWGKTLPALPLLWFTNFTGVACQVNGYALDPTGIELWNIEEISLDGECNQ
jgi:ABC-type transport system substrate-binding protein